MWWHPLWMRVEVRIACERLCVSCACPLGWVLGCMHGCGAGAVAWLCRQVTGGRCRAGVQRCARQGPRQGAHVGHEGGVMGAAWCKMYAQADAAVWSMRAIPWQPGAGMMLVGGEVQGRALLMLPCIDEAPWVAITDCSVASAHNAGFVAPASRTRAPRAVARVEAKIVSVCKSCEAADVSVPCGCVVVACTCSVVLCAPALAYLPVPNAQECLDSELKPEKDKDILKLLRSPL
jgi:hypothetical protein